MKIHLASMLESQNFGPGKVYAIATTKPGNLHVDGLYNHLTPKDELIEKYKKMQLELSDENPNAQKEASEFFTTSFYQQLKDFYKNLSVAAKEENKSLMELLPFEDGDNLVSWEREGFTSYRPMVAGLLKKIGYDVIYK